MGQDVERVHRYFTSEQMNEGVGVKYEVLVLGISGRDGGVVCGRWRGPCLGY